MFSLVREALALRQRVVATRQTVIFLQRCKANDVIPKFILKKKLGMTCNLPDNHPKIINIYRSILGIVIKEKQRVLYSSLLKCASKEQACRRLLPEQTWRRIEGRSRMICDSIRSSIKSTLCEKYDRLLSTDCGRRCNAKLTNSTEHHRSDNIVANSVATYHPARVTVLGDTHLSDSAVDFLSLGPSFAISHRIDGSTFRKVATGLHKLRDRLRLKAKRENEPQPTQLSTRPLPLVPFPQRFYKEPEPVRDVDTKFKILLTGVLNAYTHHRRFTHSNLTREQWEGFAEVRELTKNGAIRLSVSDKGGEFVVIPQVLDREITELHLQDTTLYCPVTEKDFHNQCRRLNDAWMSIGKSAGLDERFLSRLKIDTPTCPVFYSLIKTHKLTPDDLNSMSAHTYKIRPIISCIGGPADRISWFLNKIVSQILCKIPSHLTNTNHFLKQLHSARFDGNCTIESFDVTSLYTNVQNSEALQALSEMLNLHGSHLETYGLSRTRLLSLIKECLSCNIFKWSGRYFAQVRGLAMGQRLAPVLAICFMSRIEAPVLARLPIMYCRYIDDCCIITSTQSEMDECFRILNQQSQYIRLTREKPLDGWLPFLNTQISLSNGHVRVKWYRKGSCKNILIHARSAHPMLMKRAVIRNMFKTAVELCTGDDERKESRKLASDIASANGYTVFPHRNKSRTVNAGISRQNKVPLCLPFISDKISAAVRRCIVQAHLHDDVRLVNIPNGNIRSQLVRNRLYDRHCFMESCIVCPYGRTGDCAQTGVIYQLECLTCSETYIGETGRTLGIRKRVQRTLMILDGLSIPFDAIDITKPGNEEQRMFMREHAIKDDVKGTPLPPQFFYNEEYLGNFVDFEEAVEDDRIAEFLRLIPEWKTKQNVEDKENHVNNGKSS
ncbi:hypothetical protein Y032_0257g404 [Ancylostoma ceylanicum]|nr:hypothetical protein Y032_0257g404 [Ancylostoma ceylanicum]